MKNDDRDMLAKAVEQLRNEPIPPGPPQELANATLTKLNEAARQRSGRSGAGTGMADRPRTTKAFVRLTSRVAAAAVLLVLAGYTIGRLSLPHQVDEEELFHALENSLRASLEPTIRHKLIEETDRRRQLALASCYIQLKEELRRQHQDDLTRFATQTLAASNTLTNRLLAELVQAIGAAQMQDLRRVAAALHQIELNRLQDKTQLTTGLETLAYQTEDELQRTKQEMVHLLVDTRPAEPAAGIDETSNIVERIEK
ncbi:MAG: hypothetical protein JSU70_21955 [Phycisphaerales bacterium]|nr:MAG: hypothetical protein JSU70_21955 [Phycisphaerales bacterium]